MYSIQRSAAISWTRPTFGGGLEARYEDRDELLGLGQVGTYIVLPSNPDFGHLKVRRSKVDVGGWMLNVGKPGRDIVSRRAFR